jgi:hypothetical protein
MTTVIKNSTNTGLIINIPDLVNLPAGGPQVFVTNVYRILRCDIFKDAYTRYQATFDPASSTNLIGRYESPNSYAAGGPGYTNHTYPGAVLDTTNPVGWNTLLPLTIPSNSDIIVVIFLIDMNNNAHQADGPIYIYTECGLVVNSIFTAASAIIADITFQVGTPKNIRMSITNPTTGVISSSIYPGFNPAYPNGPLFYYSEATWPIPAGQGTMFVYVHDAGYNNTPNVNLTLEGCSTVVTPIDYHTTMAITDPNDPMWDWIHTHIPVEAKPVVSGYASSSDNTMLYIILIAFIIWLFLSRKKSRKSLI